MRCSRWGVLASLAWMFVAVPASADSFAGTRYELRETGHDVDARLEHGHATLVVTRTVANAAPRSDQAMFHIDLPEGAVATRLRTSGVGKSGETVWYEGELMEAEEAAKKYTELTGIGGYYPKDPALLSWRSQRHLALQVFPVLGKSSKTVEYTLRVPMHYEAGAYRMKLAALGTETFPARVRFVAATAGETVEVNGVAVGAARVQASRELEVVLKPVQMPQVEGALASFGFGEDRVLVHGRLDAAPRLGSVPAQASIALVIDGSVSMQGQLGPTLAAARAYLSHFPSSATVTVLTFDRKVHSPFGGSLPVRETMARLHTLSTMTLANGSALDEAIARADTLLAAQGAGARRVLLLTDLRTRESLTATKFAAGGGAVKSGATVHLATVNAGDPLLERDDESEWAKLPRASGGLLWKAKCNVMTDATARAIFEEWARPVRIEKLEVSGLSAAFEVPKELREGTGLEYLGIDPSAVSKVTLKGELWSRPVQWSVSPSETEARRWAGLVFGSSLVSLLDEKEQMKLAMFGRAVSPVTSYLAIEPGVRPSTEGLEEGEGLGLMGIGEGGGGFGRGIGLGHGRLAPRDREAFLAGALANAVKTCRRTGAAKATIESTLHEIVEVRDVELVGIRDAAAEKCISEEMWKVSLSPHFDDEHRRWEVASR